MDKIITNWKSKDRELIPPFPKRKKKAVGNLGFIWGLWNNPIAIWAETAFEEGIVAGPTVRGYSVMINAEEGIQHVFVKRARAYRRDRVVNRILEPALGQGLFTAEGDSWRKQRRILAPIFSPRNVSKLTDKMAEVSTAYVDELLNNIDDSGEGSAILDFNEVMTRLTFYILSNTLFSGDIAASDDDNETRKTAQQHDADFFDAITKYIESFGQLSPLDILNAPTWLPRYSKWKTRHAVKLFNDRVDGTIKNRQKRIVKGENVPDDLLTLLLKAEDIEADKNDSLASLSDKEVKDNIITFIGAGHETTARAMTWAFYLISQQPHLINDMRKEIDSVMDADINSNEWLEKMPLVRAVVEETMRLYPPAPIIIREALEDDETMGEKIPENSIALISTYVLHRHNKFWENPNAFCPERFLPENREKIPRHAYLPFGVGPRICIGAQFALQEAVIILATILKRLDIDFIGKKYPSPVQRLTLRPDCEVMMVVKPRY